MAAFNMVRMRVKPEREKEFLDLHRATDKALSERMKANGFLRGALIKTGDRTYCFFAEWESMDSLAKARPDMIGQLDRMRDMLEDLGGGLGVTDPVSGEAVAELG